jgi:hypothetical protein
MTNLPTVKMSSRPTRLPTRFCSLASSSRLWSTKAMRAVLPRRPRRCRAAPHLQSCLNRVDLPAPLGPMMPTMAPAGTLKLRLSISRRSPKDLLTLLNSMTSLPKRSATGMKISFVSLRFWYSKSLNSSKRAMRALLLAWRPLGFGAPIQFFLQGFGAGVFASFALALGGRFSGLASRVIALPRECPGHGPIPESTRPRCPGSNDRG